VFRVVAGCNMGYSIGGLICVVGFKHIKLGLPASFGLGKHILFFFSFL